MILVYLYVFLALAAVPQCLSKVTYTFLEFPYKEIPKNEAMFHEYETACALGCSGKIGVSKTLCIRQCISPSCYKDLYQSDLLEEGEVDVRLNSFKGCFIQRHNRSRT
ncbi:PREDICTED: uncharacterized protein LOC108559638 [Nicrophorus vespilloides]|uniref:Uncharacterized protein LOC108559638 n=1 Tax=Nicrophorus vespilloides TaxID=110193 RepID=A0ABM1MD15_NICVS|nr:PREDICTED: uncharacterized protein LOC108559638 [Nicrophorus vespilloides]XP_017772464.1 PREDICTED: uncharacterized protein LOC108559638 [Nicrophorus vespilloides]XP_017772465.1 PREDICTED: uncharacterized protein LOC108559638 [Nicrophorus vespilloides]